MGKMFDFIPHTYEDKLSNIINGELIYKKRGLLPLK